MDIYELNVFKVLVDVYDLLLAFLRIILYLSILIFSVSYN